METRPEAPVGRQIAHQPTRFVRHFRGQEIPLSVGGVPQEVNVHFLASQRHHIQRTVHEPDLNISSVNQGYHVTWRPDQVHWNLNPLTGFSEYLIGSLDDAPGIDDLRHSFVDDEVVGPVIGADVLDFDRRPLADPLLARLRRAERQKRRRPAALIDLFTGLVVMVGRSAVHAHQVAQDEGGHIRRLPERRVQQVRQRRRRKRRNSFRAVEGVVQSLAAPPSLRNCCKMHCV